MFASLKKSNYDLKDFFSDNALLLKLFDRDILQNIDRSTVDYNSLCKYRKKFASS